MAGGWQPSLYFREQEVSIPSSHVYTVTIVSNARKAAPVIVRLALRTRVSLVSSSACIYRRICPQRKGLQAAIFHVRYRAVAASVAALCMVVAVGTVAVSTL